MRLSSTNRFALSAVVLLAAAQAACSSPTRGEPSPQKPEAPEVVAAHQAVEVSRTKSFLDARYFPSDVAHSFVSKAGDTIDCIDFFAQPGVKELARRGTPITTRPPAVPRYRPEIGKHTILDDIAFDGSLDANGSARECSDTTVPMVRVTADDIAKAGGIDVYTNALTTKTPHDAPSAPMAATPPDGAGPYFAHAQADYNGGGTFFATQATLSIWSPALTASESGSHSLMQTWTTSPGSQWSKNLTTGVVTPCAPNCQQTVEVGWTVDPGINAGSNPTSPHLFIYSTANGYQSGCYNGTIASNAPGGGGACPSWIVSPGASLAAGATLKSSVTGGNYSELTLAVANHSAWQIWYSTGSPTPTGELGYYPQSDYSGAFQTVASVFSAGAEVADQVDYTASTGADTFALPMGSGSQASAGWQQAGYVHDYEVFQAGGNGANRSFGAPYATEPEYAVATSPGAGYFWMNYFYVGEAPPTPPGSTVGH